ncbi:60S ribosomal protein L17 [Iris pallida]|uniref:60S ribosomal protein L17 n=1 Tax=Iris pallida TaxID=29817 RepID=A0AAX6E368_IRIPA|nr:60S ribosomal protein L17 [Iris pallida]KAJ6806928.1 60S ribosomal protein L17 [Iris pallida]
MLLLTSRPSLLEDSVEVLGEQPRLRIATPMGRDAGLRNLRSSFWTC